jgi:hypothetical protein
VKRLEKNLNRVLGEDSESSMKNHCWHKIQTSWYAWKPNQLFINGETYCAKSCI